MLLASTIVIKNHRNLMDLLYAKYYFFFILILIIGKMVYYLYNLISLANFQNIQKFLQTYQKMS